MEISEYQNIYLHENSHFFYTSTHQAVLYFVKKYLHGQKSPVILDAGCGTGLLVSIMSKLGKVYGIDINPEALKFCQKRHLKHISCSSIVNTDFPDNFFDVITCIDVLYHQDVKNDLKALQELYRILKSEGILVIKVPALAWMKGKHDLIVHTRHRYTTDELRWKANKVNFLIKKLTYANLLTLPILFVIRFLEKFSPGHKASGVQKLPNLLNKFLIWIQNLELQLLIRFNLPIGYSIYAVLKKPKSQNLTQNA